MTTETTPLDDLRVFADGVTRLRRNHDALIAAAQGMVDAFDNYDGVESVIVRATDELRAAIEEATA